jgi:hypothetical protein
MFLITKKNEVIQVDADIFLLLKNRSLWLSKGRTPYVKLTDKNKEVSLHRFIMCFPSECVDHINGDVLDNRRVNLRICSNKENSWNQRGKTSKYSKYKGVTVARGKFLAKLVKEGKVYLGCVHETSEEAAIEYNRMAKEHFGDFARLNTVE